jgi:hypothetical protein
MLIFHFFQVQNMAASLLDVYRLFLNTFDIANMILQNGYHTSGCASFVEILSNYRNAGIISNNVCWYNKIQYASFSDLLLNLR